MHAPLPAPALHACRTGRRRSPSVAVPSGSSLLCCPHAWPTGTPFWKLVLKQFDDLLVKVGASCCTLQCSAMLQQLRPESTDAGGLRALAVQGCSAAGLPR